MAFTLSNKYAKNCCKRTILVQVIIEDVVTCFLEHDVVSVCATKQLNQYQTKTTNKLPHNHNIMRMHVLCIIALVG